MYICSDSRHSKKKIKKLGNVLAKEVTQILKDQNVVRLQRQKVMLVNITDEIPDCLAAVQQLLLDKIANLKELKTKSARSSCKNVLATRAH